MPFQPQVNQELTIDNATYRIAEHPAAPGIPYGQEGRQAVVYQLVAQDGEPQALKVFKPRYRLPALVGQATKIAPLADLPGLQVCRRTVLSARRNRDLLRQHPDLTYGVSMPWVQGPTWLEVMLEKRELTPEQSLELAHSLAEILATMEEHGLAHCDLSGPNVLLPSLVASAVPDYGSSIQLVDVEQLYSSDLKRPELLPGGSGGYAHKTAPDRLWGSTADRFAGAVLLGEMLGCCDEWVREAAWGENYFDPQEMQRDSERYRILMVALQERWGDGVAGLFERAWCSDVLADCATFGEWLVTLPEEVPVVEADQVDVPSEGIGTGQPQPAEGTITVLMDLGRRLEEQDNVAGALEVYRQAQALASVGSGLAEELALIVRDVEAKQEEAPGVTAPVPQPPVEEAAEEEELVAPAPRSALEQELALIGQDVETEQEELAVLAPESLLEGKVEAEVAAPDTEPPPGEEIEAEEVAPLPPVGEEIDLDRLFDEGLVAYKREEWAKAKELLAEVVRQQPDYRREGQKASTLLQSAISAVQLPQAELEEAYVPSRPPVEETGLDALFADGLAAYQRKEWTKAQELLAEVVRQQSDYEREGQKASSLLAEVEERLAPSRRRVPGWAWALGGLAMLTLVIGVLIAVWSVGGGSASTMFVSDRSGRREVYRLTGGKAVQMTHTPGDGESWAPVSGLNGAILFTSDRSGRREVYRLTGGKAVQMTHTPGDGESWSPALGPDGTILFTSDRSGKRELYRLTGGKAVQMTHTPGDGESWSPALGLDGTILFTSDRSGKLELYRLTGGKVVRMTHTPRDGESWSPALGLNGTILFTSDRSGRREVYRLTGGKVVQMTHTPGDAESWSPALRPDGTILFTSDRSGRHEMYRLTGGKVVQMTHTLGDGESWSPASE